MITLACSTNSLYVHSNCKIALSKTFSHPSQSRPPHALLVYAIHRTEGSSVPNVSTLPSFSPYCSYSSATSTPTSSPTSTRTLWRCWCRCPPLRVWQSPLPSSAMPSSGVRRPSLLQRRETGLLRRSAVLISAVRVGHSSLAFHTAQAVVVAGVSHPPTMLLSSLARSAQQRWRHRG